MTIQYFGQLLAVAGTIATSTDYPDHLVSAADESIDQCDNMYQYSCGNWLDNNQIPEHLDKLNSFTLLKEQVAGQLRSLLEAEKSSSNYAKLAKSFYKSCMDTDARDKVGGQSLAKSMERLGPWPMANDQAVITENNTIDKLQIGLTDYFGWSNLIFFYVGTNFNDPSRKVISITENLLSLSREMYLDPRHEKRIGDLKTWMTETARLMATDGGYVVPVDLELQVKKLVEFETEMAKIKPTSVEIGRRKARNNLMKVSDVRNLMPKINITGTIQQMYGNDELQAKLKADDCEMLVHNKTYLQLMMNLVDNTDKHTVFNFLIWGYVRRHADDLGTEYEESYQKYQLASRGRNQIPPRHLRCYDDTVSDFEDAVSAMYVNNIVAKDAKTALKEMVDQMMKQFKKLLKNSAWMDASTRKHALKKLKNLKIRLAYPSYLLDSAEVEKIYENLRFEDDIDLLNMRLSMNKWYYTQEGKEILNPIQKKGWQFYKPVSINAAYNPYSNEASIPAALLQPPIFYPGGFHEVNLGGIGAVIAHEIMHGFDSQGVNFDYSGRMHNWWTDASTEAFKEKQECFIEQYNNYLIPKLNKQVNGKLTLTENMADSGGLRIAYDTLNATHAGELAGTVAEKMFFRSWARLWCQLATEEVVEDLQLKDNHAPNMFRANGALANMREFREAYGCSKDSNAGRTTECTVW